MIGVHSNHFQPFSKRKPVSTVLKTSAITTALQFSTFAFFGAIYGPALSFILYKEHSGQADVDFR